MKPILKYFIIIIILAGIITIPVRMSAQSISGRLTTAFYNWEQPSTVSSSSSYFRGYQGLVLHVKNLGSPSVSFHTGLRVVEDYATDIQNNSDQRIYNFYLNVRQIGNLVDLRLGRQQIFSGVAFGTIDGAQMSFKISQIGRIELFGGSLVPLRETWKVSGWNKGNLWGSRLVVSRWDKTFMSVSYMQRNRKPTAYTQPGRYTGKIWNASSLQQELLGADVEHTFSPKVKVYGRLEGDMVYQKFDRGEGILQYSPTTNLSFTGEYFYRKPRIYHNSIFSIFTQLNSQEWWFRTNYRFGKSWSVYGGIATVQYENDSSKRIDFGVGSEFFGIGYNRRSGFEGALDGLYGNIQYPIIQKVWLRGGVFVSRYKLYEQYDEYEDLVTSFGGIKVVPASWFNFDIEGQGLRNKLFSKDMRLFIRGNFWFFNKKEKN